MRRTLRATLTAAGITVLVCVAQAVPASAHPEGTPDPKKPGPPAHGLVTKAATPCVNGTAGGFPCDKVDMLANMPLNTIGGGNGNDIWGWTDPASGKEYALMGRTNGTAFVDISNPESPIYLGNLPTASNSATWRDVKVYNNHAYIVADTSSHGLQVFDLTRLRNVTNPPTTFTADARNTSFGNAHNIAINEETGYAYAIGSNTCSGGPRMFNLAQPKNPVFAGCVSSDGYTHDAQAVTYAGPDAAHQGKEILFNSNEDTLTVFDVSTKSSPVQLSRKAYSGSGYTHQGWLTEDHRYFILNDELDEQRFGHNTRTRVWNVADLDNPTLIGSYDGPTGAIDHNLYVKGEYAYESNYRAGLRIVDLTNITNPSTMTEAGYFDVYPSSNSASFNGTWSNYPYFASGVVIVSAMEGGLFILRPNLGSDPGPEPELIYSDEFEQSGGWTTNPSGTDTATTGQWERGDPEPTTYNGAKQLGTPVSGSNDLVTGRLAGSSAGVHDIDAGATSIQSPQIALPAATNLTMSLSWYLAHASNASSADFLRVRIVHSGGTTTVLQRTGSASDVDGAWTPASADLSAYAGQPIRILVEAADAGSASLVEAGVDDVKVVAVAGD